MAISSPPLDGDVNAGTGLVAAVAVMVGLSAIFVALRIAVRYWIMKAIGWEYLKAFRIELLKNTHYLTSPQ